MLLQHVIIEMSYSDASKTIKLGLTQAFDIPIHRCLELIEALPQ